MNHHCHQCAYDWKTRKRILPRRCPTCQSERWNKPLGPGETIHISIAVLSRLSAAKRAAWDKRLADSKRVPAPELPAETPKPIQPPFVQETNNQPAVESRPPVDKQIPANAYGEMTRVAVTIGDRTIGCPHCGHRFVPPEQ